VSSAASTTEAMDMIRAVHPSVILCDIATPISEAFGFIHDLRNSPDARLKTMPVIVTTTLYEDVDERTARAAGFDVFLRKPLDPEILPDVIGLLVSGVR
jgi:CheY-like chemotaxis protein